MHAHVCAVIQAGVVNRGVTYSVAWCRKRRPIGRWMERLLDFCSDDPGGQKKKADVSCCFSIYDFFPYWKLALMLGHSSYYGDTV